MTRIAILGGSSPFTIELINRLRDRAILNKIDPMHILLYGRNIKVLKLIEKYGNKTLGKLGWNIESSIHIEKVLSEVDIILYQIRYGGLEGRKNDEDLAMKYGFFPDETIGPSGLQSAIRMSILQKEMIQNILKYSPKALIICLTNPLSICVHLLRNAGIKNVVGLCELPDITAKKIADLLNIDVKEMKWDYIGLNHRGFIYNLRVKDELLFERFCGTIKDDFFEGIRKEMILNMQAVPTKHFQLFFSKKKTHSYRSKKVQQIRNELITNLSSSFENLNTILSKRYMAWYSHSVVPFIEAYQNNSGKKITINYHINDYVKETKVKVYKDKILLLENDKPASKEVDSWINRFIEYERATIKTCTDFNKNHILDALSKDPLLRVDDGIKKMANDIYSHNIKYLNDND